MASPALARALIAAAVGCAATGGCRSHSDVAATLALAPASPVVGADTIARVTLRDTQGRAVSAARVQIEAHMTHPGMAPIVVAASSRGGGSYEARLRFTMAGDWILVATGELPDGSRIAPRDMTVRGVRPD